MPPPREPDHAEPTLVPGSPSGPAARVPADTPAHPAADDGTIAAPVPAPVPVPAPKPAAHPSLGGASRTEVDADLTRVPTFGGATGVSRPGVDATGVEATAVPPSAGSPSADRTIAEPAAGSGGTTGSRVGRFALKGLHARGGLGEVFTARDTELNREVAVKRIQSRYADDPGSRRRFLTEAEITARLDHPGVVPVFGLVSDGLGRPCYAMRFIRGETLKDEIDRYHQGAKGKGPEAEKAGPKPDDRPAAGGQPRSVAFRHLLQRFIAVCQAIAYAHTRKVIHRDIKPANVMVGAFGETLVVDWGLAKALDDGPTAETLLKAAAEVGFRRDPEATELPDHMTQAGTAVGTPAYMAPEQASGRLDILGPPADVYALGATLYAILTGRAPFSGGTGETLEKVRKGDFQPPVAVNPETPRPLDSVCRKAMALRPEDRYATALDLAADVERWLSDEPVSCHRDPLLARLARWARRHPARVAAGVSLLLAGGFAAVVIAWAVNEGRKNTAAERDRATDAEKKTAAAFTQLTEEQGKTKQALAAETAQKQKTEAERQRAEAARDVASDRYDLAVQAFNTLVTDIQKQLADRAGTQDLRKTLLEQAQKGLTALTKGGGEKRIGADRTLVAAHRQMGDVYLLLGDTRKAREEYDTAVEMAIEVLTRTQAGRDGPAELQARQALGRAYVRRAEVHHQAGNTAAAKRDCELGLEQLREVLKAKPKDREACADVAAAEDRLADIHMERGETGPAVERCEAGLKTRRTLADGAPEEDLEARRHLADSLGQYAEILLRSGRTADALATAGECLKVRAAVAEKLPGQPDVRLEHAAAHARLGEIHIDRGNLADARTEYQAALKVLKALTEDDPRSAGARAALAEAHGRLAAIATRTGDLDAALKDATAGHDLCEQLAKADPESARAKRDLARGAERLGEVLLARGKPDEALAAFRRSAELLGPVQAADKESARAKFELARSLERVGEGKLATADPAGAVAALTESVALRETVLGVDAASARAKRELAVGLGWLSDAHRAAGNPGPARDAVARAVALLRAVVEGDKDNTPGRRELAAATGKWGEVLSGANKPTAALVAVSKALDEARSLADADKGNVQAKADAAAAWERVAGVYAEHGQTEPAMAAARTALDLRTELARQAGETKAAKRDLAAAMTRVADTYAAVRQFEQAKKWYRTARELVVPDPADPLTTAVARRADDHLALVDATDVVIRDPLSGVDQVPEPLRVRALRTAIETLLRANQPVTAGAVAGQLATRAKTPADRYAAARALARCAGATGITPGARDAMAVDAVQALEAAVKAGFRDPDALAGPEWDPCRTLPAFQAVVKQLGKS